MNENWKTILHSSLASIARLPHEQRLLLYSQLIALHVFVFIIGYVENIKMQWPVRVRVCARDHRIDRMSVVVHISLDSASSESINNCNASGRVAFTHNFFFKCIVYYCFAAAAKKIEARIIVLSLNRYERCSELGGQPFCAALVTVLCSISCICKKMNIALNGSLVICFIVRRNAHGLANGWR